MTTFFMIHPNIVLSRVMIIARAITEMTTVLTQFLSVIIIAGYWSLSLLFLLLELPIYSILFASPKI